MTILRAFVPFLGWIGELRSAGTLRADLIAGITVALVLIPQSMAYAQLAGLPAYYGLYASFLPPVVAALMGSSRQLATGPVAVVSLMTAAALEPIAAAGGGGYAAYAVLLALIVGAFQLALGLFRLGILVNFLSHPVVLGFTNAAAIIIASSQLGKILGVQVEKAEHHYETVWNIIRAGIENPHVPTLLMAVTAFFIMFSIQRINPRLPSVLIAVVVTTLLSWGLGYSASQTVEKSQLIGGNVQRILADIEKLPVEIQTLNTGLAEARKRWTVLKKRPDADEAEILSARHTVDLLTLKRERRVKSMKADVKELKIVHFKRVSARDGAPDRFYVPGHLPEGATSEEDSWRIMDIADDGRAMLHRGGYVVGTVPSGLPGFRLPQFRWDVVAELFTSAFAIALIGFMEAIAIAKGMATRTKQVLDANQELIGQGIGNITGSLFQSYPTAGSFSRSAVNFNAGAVTGFSSAVTSLVVVVVLLWLTPLLYHLPQATLAAVIMMAVIGLIRFEPVRHAWKIDRNDGVVSVTTFVLTLLLAPHLDQGIVFGVLLSLGLYLFRSMKPRIASLSRHPDGSFRDSEVYGLQSCENISILRFDGSLYFADTSYFEDKVLESVASKPELRYVIVDAEGINYVDATGEEMLRQIAERLQSAGIELLLSRMKKQVMDVLERGGFFAVVERSRFFRRTEQALEYAWKGLEAGHAGACPLAQPETRVG